jgi:periplasmic protein CpxP/Spy
MKRILVITTVALLGLGTAAHAQTPQPAPGPQPRAEQIERMERRAARMEQRMNQRLQELKGDLKLTAQQEPLWSPIEAQLRKIQAERRAFRQSNAPTFRNAELPQRLDLMAERQASAARNMRDLSAAVRPLWATMTDAQKETVRDALPGRGRWNQ